MWPDHVAGRMGEPSRDAAGPIDLTQASVAGYIIDWNLRSHSAQRVLNGNTSNVWAQQKGPVMELFWLVIPVMLLVALDLAALRFGADSRPRDHTRPNWW